MLILWILSNRWLRMSFVIPTSLEPDSSRDQAIHRHPVHDQLFFEHRRGMCVQPTSAGNDQTTEEHKYTAILKEFL